MLYYRATEDTLCEYSANMLPGDCLETDIVTYEEMLEDPSRVMIEDGVLVLDPTYPERAAQKERERINNLQCTKRVFALMLEELGITYDQLKALIATNSRAQMEWELCVELQRGNPLIDIFGEQLGITSEQIDILFKVANGELPVEALRETGSSEEEELEIDDSDEEEEELEVDDSDEEEEE